MADVERGKTGEEIKFSQELIPEKAELLISVIKEGLMNNQNFLETVGHDWLKVSNRLKQVSFESPNHSNFSLDIGSDPWWDGVHLSQLDIKKDFLRAFIVYTNHNDKKTNIIFQEGSGPWFDEPNNFGYSENSERAIKNGIKLLTSTGIIDSNNKSLLQKLLRRIPDLKTLKPADGITDKTNSEMVLKVKDIISKVEGNSEDRNLFGSKRQHPEENSNPYSFTLEFRNGINLFTLYFKNNQELKSICLRQERKFNERYNQIGPAKILVIGSYKNLPNKTILYMYEEIPSNKGGFKDKEYTKTEEIIKVGTEFLKSSGILKKDDISPLQGL